MKLHLQFQRFECKYLVTERQVLAIRKIIEPWVEPDPHAADRLGFSYPIASLYLDTPGLRLHRETREGQRNRFKLRIRTYSDDSDAPVFFEIKRRNNQVVRKSRSVVSRDGMRQFLWGGGIDIDGQDGRGRDALAEFAGKTAQIGALPVVSVSYNREAYVGLFDSKTRITFDRNIRCRPASGSDLRMEATDWAPIEGRRVVVEMKFDGRLPSWMASVIHRCELQRISYSKYSRSIIRQGANLMRSNIASH